MFLVLECSYPKLLRIQSQTFHQNLFGFGNRLLFDLGKEDVKQFVEECAHRIVVGGYEDLVVVIKAKTQIAFVDALVILLCRWSEVDRPTLAVDGYPAGLDLHGVVS